jgi:putative addiction module component (TIGR02574 family)
VSQTASHTRLVQRDRLDEILDLPVAERLRLVEEIWESIVASPESLPLPESHRIELDRRLKLHRESPDAAEPWETIRSRFPRSE